MQCVLIKRFNCNTTFLVPTLMNDVLPQNLLRCPRLAHIHSRCVLWTASETENAEGALVRTRSSEEGARVREVTMDD